MPHVVRATGRKPGQAVATVGLILAVVTATVAGDAPPARADAVDALVNPLVDATQLQLMAVSLTTSPMTFILLESWRQWGLAVVGLAVKLWAAASLAPGAYYWRATEYKIEALKALKDSEDLEALRRATGRAREPSTTSSS